MHFNSSSLAASLTGAGDEADNEVAPSLVTSAGVAVVGEEEAEEDDEPR